MSIYRVIKGAVTTKDGMVNEGGEFELPPEDGDILVANGFVELATPVSAPSVEVAVEAAPVVKPVAVVPPAAVKGKK